MSQKTIMLVFLLAVAAVGIGAMLGNFTQTGAAVVQRYCMCSITQYDYYGNPIGTMQQRVRVQTAEAHTDAACNIRCDQMFTQGGWARVHATGVAV
ncbi:hypothetical protein KY319_02255 [Candidatus Woesearchaeota archaeon]|nr:hypothetical protein [Candidatus Woesearchaeota archaeon]